MGEELALPIIPIKTKVLLPGEVNSIQLRNQGILLLIKDLYSKDRPIGLVYSPNGENGNGDSDLNRIGTMMKILFIKSDLAGATAVVLEGVTRIALLSIKKETPHVVARVALIEETAIPEMAEQLCREIIDIIGQLTKTGLGYSEELLSLMELGKVNPSRFVDRVAANYCHPIDLRQKILETLNLDKRLEIVLEFLRGEMLWAGKLAQDHGIGAGDRIILEMRERINQNRGIPLEIRGKCLAEIDRLGHLSTASVEYGATRQFIDWLFDIPWNIANQQSLDLKKVEKELDRGYYGSKSIKKQILERIAIRELSGGRSEGPILCLAGVPGTGKASLAKAIARSTGRKFLRISVGGISEVSDIKGTSRTFMGAMPGIIVRALKDTGTSDPVVFIEDIDYFAESSHAVLSMSLLEAIDPRLNSRFLDNYIGFPIDLGRVLFICAVKSVEDIPEVFSHRFEIIELPGYIEKEKIHIARKHIIPTVLKKHGLLKRDITFSEKGLQKIIRNYTLEAGLLNFKRRIEMICRHVAKEKAGNLRKIWVVNEKTVGSFLGTSIYTPEKPGDCPQIGVAVGLAWTGQGGDLMIIEGLRMKGSGEVITTGSLGDVMKESIQAAHSYVRSKADILGIDHADFDNFDIHIHFPSGAIPKDGPSAGVAVSLVIASVMAERPIRNDIAMTGEVTLRGKVLPVGGLIEKISAAYRAGIPRIFIPRENKKDLKNLPSDILKKTKFILIDTVDDVFARGLLDFVPSSYTLEKIFAAEMEKAKSRKKPSPSRKIAAKGSRKR